MGSTFDPMEDKMLYVDFWNNVFFDIQEKANKTD
jgi:hypothetical protein